MTYKADPSTVHVYTADPALPDDHRGDGLCTCGLPKRNVRHDLPLTSKAQRQVQERYDKDLG